ncbi:MAG: hypothetical protein AAF513_02395 [Pseudomonadota bacterium]
MRTFNWVRQIGTHRFGITHDFVTEGDEVYLERWIMWFGLTLRLHKFHKGDDDRAFHDHPWWFVTIPTRNYAERTPQQTHSIVRAWRPHFRPAHYRHIVALLEDRPVWTLIITGPKVKEWGFWEADRFIHHEEWSRHCETKAGAGENPIT